MTVRQVDLSYVGLILVAFMSFTDKPKLPPFRFRTQGVKSHHDMEFAPWR